MTKAAGAKRGDDRASILKKVADGLTALSLAELRTIEHYVARLSKHPRGSTAGSKETPQTALDRARANFESFRKEIVAHSLSLTQAAKRMDLTTEGLSVRVDRGEMVAFRDGNRKMVPIELLDDNQPSRTVQGLPEVIHAASAAGMEPFRLAAWLVSPSRALGDRRPVDELRRGRVAKVVRAVESLGAN